MSVELQKIIEKEELIQDSQKLKKFNEKIKLHSTIDKIRDKFASKYEDMNDLDIIYKFAEALKKHLD